MDNSGANRRAFVHKLLMIYRMLCPIMQVQTAKGGARYETLCIIRAGHAGGAVSRDRHCRRGRGRPRGGSLVGHGAARGRRLAFVAHRGRGPAGRSRLPLGRGPGGLPRAAGERRDPQGAQPVQRGRAGRRRRHRRAGSRHCRGHARLAARGGRIRGSRGARHRRRRPADPARSGRRGAGSGHRTERPRRGRGEKLGRETRLRP